MKFSEKAYVNRTAIICHTIISGILVAAYTLELVKGARTVGYYAVFVALCVIPIAAEIAVFCKDKENKIIRHIISSGYGVFYLFTVFTTTSLVAFTYAFPMFIVIILYMDVQCCAMVAGGAVFGNVAYVIYYAFTIQYQQSEIADVEIRIACTVVTAAFMIWSTVAVKRVNNEKLNQIREQSDSATALTKSLLDTSGKMITDISQAAEKVETLGESVANIRDSMNEVSTGSTETAEAVQLQLQRTEQIQNDIARVKDTARRIEKSMSDTSKKVEEGRNQMDSLTEQVEKSNEANIQVIERMKALGEYASLMNTIIETITSIASSTGMLALNASIEAARAGEAGRGFAVVAGQISELASQTKAATVNITELIGNINKELTSVEKAVEVVTDSNQSNAESAQVVSENFVGITEGTVHVNQQAGELMKIVDQLEKANADIVENIQTISAITEEVSAHAGETYDACETNALLVSSVTEIVENLSAEAQKLQQNR